MADTIERVIFGLEIDGSGYIKGADSLIDSTKKLTAEQERANKALQQNEAALKAQSEFLQKSKKDLDAYTGTNEKYRAQLQKSFKDAQTDNIKLTELVNNNRKAYEQAQKAAQDFANISARATQLQQGTTGGKIPTGPPPGISTPISSFNLSDVIPQTTAEFEQLAFAIANAEQHLSTLDAESEEFKLIKPVVDQAKVALQQYDAVTKSVGGSTLSLRTQIRQGRDELVRLEEAGKGTSKEYFELEKRVAKLTDAFNDQQARIKILASDTKLLDFGKGAITAATSAFQTYASISILAGDESAELQKKTMQLFAAMQLLQSLEQLSNLTRREGVLAVHLQSAAQTTYTAVVGASTGALRVFRLALLATGIGAVIVGIGFLVSKFNQLKEAQRAANAEAKLLKEINEKAIESYAGEVTKIDILRRKLTDLTISQKERIAFAKEYNKTADESNKIDLKQIDNIDLLNAAITRQIAKIKERALAQASANVAEEKAATFLKEQANIINKFPSLPVDDATLDRLLDEQKRGVLNFTQFSKKQHDEFIDAIISGDLKKFVNARNEFNKSVTIAAGLSTPEQEKTRQIQNEFERKKAELDQRLAELTRQEADNESKIRIEFAARLAKEQLEIDKLLKDKKLTDPQAEILKAENIQINKLELEKALADFNKKVTDARKKLNDELKDLQEKNSQDQINLIQDEFDRRAALIEFNEKKELADAEENTQKRLQALDFERLLIGEQAYQDAKARIISAGELQALNIIREAAQDRQDLAADTFDTFFTFIDDEISRIDLVKDQEIAKGVQEAKSKFLAGQISFIEFQKRIDELKRDAELKARQDTLFIQQAELQDLQTKIDNTEDKTTKHYKSLVKKAEQLKKDIAAAQSDTSDVEDPNKKQVETVQQYAEAIGAVAESVVSFWQKANEAESAALDKSIALQEKRVEAAQRIAERGNAQYLKQEEDRLKELQVQKENAARRELAINAALQASQLLVGITGAIAKIATPGIGIAETIGAIAVIFSALATGYGLVRSLQGSQPKLKKGTKYVKREGHPSGEDTIPAWLNEGEAVIPTDKNRAYHPTVKAVYEGTIPAEHLNRFVNTYHKIKGVPQLDYNKIKDTAELHIAQDGKMAVLIQKIDENNQLQKDTIRALKARAVNVNMDKEGFAMSFMEVVAKNEIDRHI